ncbi:hypothetical protein AGABI2DRAFT_189684 [Agaricus bisporus var. bisporus H97]|uniref:hypothetical protein n=1 Tax=Agaricus bisporus var. bisporus (strain H97 / ATCC MYA-4626 / FGSC 10389) TaxID=936046 RepID=UPI00029F52B4|nr:hypothetical protein AGABI2DRAFT_189684 [Agaricus bisporus var. bisporus H97]EKV51422.1 hypothetical protein AGABI2DRAFT_189684 [Agaricus bisporus var. bisporus H97]
MPSLCDSYDVLLEFTNDTPEAVTIQLLRDYGRGGGGVVLLNSSESVTLVLESGSAYRYAVKMCTRVVSITARTWRNMQCPLSHVFSSPISTPSESTHSITGVRVDGLFRDHRTSVWSES